MTGNRRSVLQGIALQAFAEARDASKSALSYDRADRLTRAEDSQAGTHTQAYDALDRLTRQGGPQGSVSYAYDRSGRRTQMDASGQPATTYSYDPAGRLTGLSRGAQTVAMGYDPAGRRQTTTLPNGITRTDGYDAASRLTSIVYRRGAETLGDLNYEYDSAGRRTAQWGTLAKTALPEEMSSATYDQANRQTERGGVAQAYDQEGNLTSDGQNTFSWDARGELASLEGPDSSASFRYDPFGRRSQKTVGGQLVQGQSTDYLHDGQNVVQEQRGGEATDLLQGGTDEIFARTKGAQTETFLTDGLGSTAALASASGAPQTNYRYDPCGGSTEEGAPADNAWRFTGREDDSTGLLHYRARYMSAGSARFASEDPIGLAGGDPNLYAYVGGDPVNAVDPSGLSPFEDWQWPSAEEWGNSTVGALDGATFGRTDWARDQLYPTLGLQEGHDECSATYQQAYRMGKGATLNSCASSSGRGNRHGCWSTGRSRHRRTCDWRRGRRRARLLPDE